MPAHKRKLSFHPKPPLHHVRSSGRLRKLRYAVESDSDSEISPKPALEASEKRQSLGRQRARTDESGDEYINDVESEESGEEDQDEEGDRTDDDSDSKLRTPRRDQSDGDLDEDELPRVTIIPLERLRETGDIEYVDYRIHPNSLLFLTDLKDNNNRAWLKAHNGEFRRAFKDWETFVECTTSSVIAVDETVPDLPAKDVMFRIYRDLRFSPDKKPYKAHFSAAWSRTGRKGTYAHYYIHCEPGASMIAGGIFAPNAQQLQSIRSSIDERPRRWRRILNENSLKQSFMPGIKTGSREEDALKYFAHENKESALKTKPKGFIADHRDIELLKLRKFTLSKKIEDDLLLADNTQEKIIEILRPLVGFITFLNSIVMPDGDSSSSDSDHFRGDD
ncbi:unnamed protein product [Clonostachys rhizophaga]|uniref:DUF2461 domain-containing protein n=1 Tax=Clonostachys rhizophaga TaxID=160324 RepID=A0A9N9V7Z8_9HYPO|nr:unnamed protein product [Clonostachys rhizophaga]